MNEKIDIRYTFDGPVPTLTIVTTTEDEYNKLNSIKQTKVFKGEIAVLLWDILCGPDMTIWTSRNEFEAVTLKRTRVVQKLRSDHVKNNIDTRVISDMENIDQQAG